MQKLSVPSYPLKGRSLIEASAGTGKTFTISALYNRIITGHNSARLGCDQILLVTFTEAATEELRGRIRQRIQDSFIDVLRMLNGQDAEDENLALYIQDIVRSSGKPEDTLLLELKHWLQTNLTLMDEASIFTIHGFCGKMLKRFAFDSGVMFSAELTLDSDKYLMQACEDVWRQVAYSLDFAQSQKLLATHKSPKSLFDTVRSRIGRSDITILPETAKHSFNEAWQTFTELFTTAKGIAEKTPSEDIEALISSSNLRKQSYSSKNLPNWLRLSYQYLLGDDLTAFPKQAENFTYAVMEEKSKDGSFPTHPLFDAIDALWHCDIEIQSILKNAWLEDIKERYFDSLEQAGILTPDDLLRLLSQALVSEFGDQLAEQIRTLYPVAMIDEFQDTDPIQYGIFSRIYPAQNESSDPHALIMIGDPKQAIYAFRGADIFTYIRAKRELNESQRFTLDKNWRSHSQLVQSVNTVFSGHSAPFVYNDDIAFSPVDSSNTRDNNALVINDAPVAPLQFWLTQEESNRYQASQDTASECAAQIQQLLTGSAQLGKDKVQARDIAILVRTGKQAKIIRNALNERNISSVFLTRDSVFKTQEAQDLLRWLQSVAHPTDERALRSSLITLTQNYSAAEIDELLVDEHKWEEALAAQQGYLQLWLKRGIMAAIMSWLETDELAIRLRKTTDGERRLTNLMHLGDLLQQRSRKLRGHEALLRWFTEHVLGDDEAGEESQLRLESDANLVSIVTIHKSKGLQYPLVFLPFLWDDTAELSRFDDIIYFDTDQQVKLHLNPKESEKDKAKEAKLAEYLRLLYVALTRAEQGCFVWIKDVVDGRASKNKKTRVAKTALGYVLNINDDPNWQALIDRLTENDITISALPSWQSSGVGNNSDDKTLVLNAAYAAPKEWDNWRVSSYSQLAHQADKLAMATEPMVQLKDDESTAFNSYDSEQETPIVTTETEQEFDSEHIAFTFVKGANAGTCLHEIFEHWDFHDQATLPELVATKLEHYGIDFKEEQLPDLVQWMSAIVQTPLQDAYANQFDLQQVSYEKRLDEMEFFLPVANLAPSQLEALLGSSQRFNFNPLTGYLKGFIDLIFCHNGRYYVADYKSNHLGRSLADYRPDNLTDAMLSHAYDMQAWIYTLALDALLARRIKDYDPQQHLGGVYYFFLRGMHLGAEAPLFKNGDTQQAPGVYYHAVDTEKLKQWRTLFNGKSA